jgi:hypothetical protein
MRAGLLALSTLLLGSAVLADEAEHRAVEAVEKLGGRLTRDEKAADRPVIGLNLRYTRLNNAGLKELVGLKALRSLDLAHTKVSDTGLKELRA